MKLPKRVKPFLWVVFLFGAASVLLVRSSRAEDLSVTCGNSGCSSIGTPLFSESTMHPGKAVTQRITVTNNYPDTRSFALQLNNFMDTSGVSLAEALEVSITDETSGASVYSGKSVKEWYEEGYLLLSSVESGQSKVFAVTVQMADVGNEYQGKQIEFDMSLGFDSVASPTPTPAPSDGGGQGEDGDGGGVGGATVTGLSPTPSPTGAVAGAMSYSTPIGRVLGSTDETEEELLEVSMPEPEEMQAPGEVLGASSCVNVQWWWWPLLAQAVLTVLILVFRKLITRARFGLPLTFIILAGLSQLAHYLIGCPCVPGLCNLYWAYNLTILGMGLIIHRILFIRSE